MEFKRIVVLANSIKKNGRCVAGREVGDDEVCTDKWLRPISTDPEGTLMPKHMIVNTGGRPLKVFDIVDVPLTSHANDDCHPEDWTLDGQEWQHVGRFDRNRLPELEETPRDLWLEDPSHPDRVTCSPGLCHKRRQSLYLVRPKNLRIRLSREYNEHKGYIQNKRRAVFSYGDAEYVLGLTDPVITDKYCQTFPKPGQPPHELRLPFRDQCLLCVSFTPKFNGYHYKVIAAVLQFKQKFSLIPNFLRRNK